MAAHIFLLENTQKNAFERIINAGMFFYLYT